MLAIHTIYCFYSWDILLGYFYINQMSLISTIIHFSGAKLLILIA